MTDPDTGYAGVASTSESPATVGTEPEAGAAMVSLVSVNVSLPRVIGELRTGAPVVSGIDKRPVTAEHLALDVLNLEGDRQADLDVHGGRDKAVYAYLSGYLRVLRLGTVAVRGPISIVELHPAAVSVLDAYRSIFSRPPSSPRKRVAAVDALADDVRTWLLEA